jgi:cell division protein FtsQ
MPRLTAPRAMAASSAPRMKRAPGPRVKIRKTVTVQDRLSARALFVRRLRRSLRPGLWLLAGVSVLLIGSELFREMPAVGRVSSPVGSLRHDFGALAALMGFRVSALRVQGADTTPVPAIAAALGVHPGDPILGFSLAAAQARIEALGPVQSAVVERVLPGTLVVTITERAPYAIWQSSGANGAPHFVVIDKSGDVIADQDAIAAKRREPGLLLLSGAGGPEMAATLIRELIARPELRGRVVAAARIDGLRWNLILRDRAVVKLPEQNEPQALDELVRLQAGMALLDRPVEVIDLRLPGRMVIRPYPSPAPEPAPAGHPK